MEQIFHIFQVRNASCQGVFLCWFAVLEWREELLREADFGCATSLACIAFGSMSDNLSCGARGIAEFWQFTACHYITFSSNWLHWTSSGRMLMSKVLSANLLIPEEFSPALSLAFCWLAAKLELRLLTLLYVKNSTDCLPSKSPVSQRLLCHARIAPNHTASLSELSLPQTSAKLNKTDPSNREVLVHIAMPSDLEAWRSMPVFLPPEDLIVNFLYPIPPLESISCMDRPDGLECRAMPSS